jgi:hypothetical protein
VKKDPKSEFESLIKKSDVIVIMMGACKHASMWCVKELAEYYSKPVVYHQGRGGTGAIRKCMDLLIA